MAMIKVEYLAPRHALDGVPLRTRLLAHLPRHLHRYPALKTLLRWRNKLPLLARLAERLFSITAKHQLPEPAATPFAPRGKESTDPKDDQDTASSQTEVVLLIDTFTRHYAPKNAAAAIRVLERAGYRVIPAEVTPGTPDAARPLCCGRTYIAHGLVDQARTEARRMLAALLPHAEAGRSIVGLEPACLLAVRDDYRFLGLGEAAETVAAQALLFEEFIAREINAKRFDLELKPVDTRGYPLLVHGHCHQKAVGAMKSMRKLLKAIPDLEFKLIDSTCCGMAGSFGIEQEHAEMAMAMAEQNLLPELRTHADSRIVANGFSCRHQIELGVDRPAIHIAGLLNEALA
jgi:Fe-S oxidoreductase